MKSSKKYKQKVDTNVFQVSMSCLTQKFELATGDPFYCSGCNAVFNKYSLLVKNNTMQTWNCEFCNIANLIQIEPEELPKSETVSYILEAATLVQNKEEGKKGELSKIAEDISIVYCIDLSGSMEGYKLESVKNTIRA